MQIFGYDIKDKDLDLQSPRELSECTLYVTIAELEQVITFLQHARKQLDHPGRTPDSHVHFRDWTRSKSAPTSDLIVTISDPAPGSAKSKKPGG